MAERPQRKHLPHDIPNWVEDGAVFFITICAAERSKPTLTVDPVPRVLMDAIAHYHKAARWYCHLFVIMPDHIHALISLPRDEELRTTIAQWKSYTAKAGAFHWQRDFFDHRLRAEESFDEKAHYIRQNPVRAGLTNAPEHWPHIWAPPDAR
jgi:putative transposase